MLYHFVLCPFVSTVPAFVHVLKLFDVDEYRTTFVNDQNGTGSELVVSNIVKLFYVLPVFTNHLLAFELDMESSSAAWTMSEEFCHRLCQRRLGERTNIKLLGRRFGVTGSTSQSVVQEETGIRSRVLDIARADVKKAEEHFSSRLSLKTDHPMSMPIS
jgi:hypothetical protein